MGDGWSIFRDVVALLLSGLIPITLYVVGIFHKANIKRFDEISEQLHHQDECIDSLKNEFLSSAKNEVTRPEMDASLNRVVALIGERMAANMTSVTTLLGQRETTLASTVTDLRERLRVLESLQMERKQ